MLTQMSESEFNDTDPAFRVIAHDHPWRFGRLQLLRASHPLVMSWRSDLIEPTLIRDEELEVVWIGVDQRLACVSFDACTLFSVGLASRILQLKNFEGFTVALCETEVLVVNHDYTLRAICSLPEIPDTVDMRDGKLVVALLDGNQRICAI